MAEPDLVDLTADSPPGQVASKRSRTALGGEEEARAAIMGFAKRARTQPQQERRSPGRELHVEPANLPVATAAGQPGDPEQLLTEEEQKAARQRIMAFAQRVSKARELGAMTSRDPQPSASAQPPGSKEALGVDPAAAAPAGAAAGSASNSLLAQLHAERAARRLQRQPKQQMHLQGQQVGVMPATASATAASGATVPLVAPVRASAPLNVGQQHQHQQQAPLDGVMAAANPGLTEVSLLSYNLWFREDVEVEARMQTVGGIIADQGFPHFLCFQEVTPLIHLLLQQSPWWRKYAGGSCPPGATYFTMLLWRKDVVEVSRAATIPFANSVMGRDLKCIAATVVGMPLLVATSHLESPTGSNQLYSRQRVAQCKQAALLLEKAAKGSDIVFAGDMNWNPDDGQPCDVLPGGWCDAWVNLHTGDPGLTYDPKANPMLNPRSRIRRRLDRAFCRLSAGGWRLAGMEMVGREPLPGLQHEGRPVLPSDHFGLLLRLAPA